MADGTFLTHNKIRPGAYINVTAEPKTSGAASDRGIVVLPLATGWGEKFTKLNAGEDTLLKLGYDLTSNKLLLVKEAMKNASKVYVYRLDDGSDENKAKATIGDSSTLQVTAKYAGTRGNDIKISIGAAPGDDSGFIVETYLMDGDTAVLKDKQTVASAAGLADNDWVVFDKAGTLSATAGTSLTGGKDATVTNQQFTDFMSYIENIDYNTVAFPVALGESDAQQQQAALMDLVKTYITRMRETLGKKVQAVIPYYEDWGKNMDYEGIIQVLNGVKMADGTILDNAAATAWVAGCTAGANVNQSNTYKIYDGAQEAYPLLTDEEITDALGNGMFLFDGWDGNVKVEMDINSYHSFSASKPRGFSKNRVVRVMDSIANDIKTIFGAYYIGKVNNNADGRNLFKKEVIQYLENLQNIAAIQNFDSSADVIVEAGNELDQVICSCNVQPVDSMEKLYMTVTLSL